jgi:hypothetical protein
MTNPSLSIETSHEIGRLYQEPLGSYEKKISSHAARKGLEAGTLFPSITNVVSAINPKMEGYVEYMTRKGLQEGMQREEALKYYDRHRINASDRGTRVHGFIEDFIEAGFADAEQYTFTDDKFVWLGEGDFKTLPSFINCLNHHDEFGDLKHLSAFFRFLRRYEPVFTFQEATVYGTSLFGDRYAGTTDFAAYINGKLVLGDWKASKTMSANVSLQLSAAFHAEKMTTDFETLVDVPKFDTAWGVQLCADGQYHVYEATDISKAFKAFSAARTAWDFYANKKTYIEEIG